MGTSDITVAALTATPTLRGNKLAWTYSDPRNNALPNIGLDMVEVHASTTNDRTAATKVGEGIADFLHAGLVEEQTWYYWIKARDYLGGFGAWYPSGSTSGVSATAIGMSGLAFVLANGKLVATANSPTSNKLTIAVKAADGNDPSAANPVYVAFRNASLGSYNTLSLTGALSLTISAGSTLGAAGGGFGGPFRIWVVIFDDAGTYRLGVRNCRQGLITHPLFESGTMNATAEGGTGTADLAGFTYASQAISAKSFRIVGYMDWFSGFPGSLGNWSVGPDAIRLFGPGVPTPGQLIQEAVFFDSTLQQTTSLIPFDNSIPQIGEGLSFGTVTLTPQSSCNLIDFEVEMNISHSVASTVAAAFFRDALPDSLLTGWTQISAANEVANLHFRGRRIAGDGAQRTYALNIGAGTAGTLTINGVGTNPRYGDLDSSFYVKEIMG
jgi:hypothetical protein